MLFFVVVVVVDVSIVAITVAVAHLVSLFFAIATNYCLSLTFIYFCLFYYVRQQETLL